MEINFDLDTNELADEMEDAINNIVESYLSNELQGAIDEYICHSSTIENMIENEVSNQVTNETRLEDLLSAYNPGNGCTLGNEFTDAVQRAIKHIFGELYIGEISKTINVQECVNVAVSKYVQENLSSLLAMEVRKAIINGVAESLRNDILLEVKRAFTSLTFLNNI